MTKASDNVFPKVILDTQSATPAAPSGGQWKVYARADGIYAVGSNASPAGPFGSGTAAGVVPWAILPYGGVSHRGFVTLGAANRAIYVPCVIPAACTITGIRVRIGTSSGNISVALVDGSGSRVATSGAVASPGTGLRNISFTGNYSAAAGRYYLAISADNNTITFSSTYDGATADPATAKYQETAHPVPATPSFSEPVFALNLIGLISGGYPS